MFHSSSKLVAIYPENAFAQPIKAADAVALQICIQQDAAWSYRSAIASLVAALQGVHEGRRSWPVIQLYYSLFYSVRSILYSNSICIYFSDRKPVQAVAKAGESPAFMRFQGSGSTHIAAAHVFRLRFPRHPLTGDIDFIPALDWMRNLRETVNYREPMMNLDDRLGFFSRVYRREFVRHSRSMQKICVFMRFCQMTRQLRFRFSGLIKLVSL